MKKRSRRWRFYHCSCGVSTVTMSAAHRIRLVCGYCDKHGRRGYFVECEKGARG